MTSSNGNIFRVTGSLCGEFTGPGEFPTQRPVTQSFDVFFNLRLNKRLSKQPWGWWFETLSWSLWRQCKDTSAWQSLIWRQHPHITVVTIMNYKIKQNDYILVNVNRTICSYNIDGLVQERRNSSALAMEFRLSCTNPSTCATCIWHRRVMVNKFTILWEVEIIRVWFCIKIPVEHKVSQCGIRQYYDDCCVHSGISILIKIISYIELGPVALCIWIEYDVVAICLMANAYGLL